MRRSRFKRRSFDEEHNFLASVSDLSSALLFVFIIALSWAMIQAQEQYLNTSENISKYEELAKKRAEEAQKEEQEITLKRNKLTSFKGKLDRIIDQKKSNPVACHNLLKNVQTQLSSDFNINVNIDDTKCVIRIPEEAVTFETGRDELNEENLKKVEQFGNILAKNLHCYRNTSLLQEEKKECSLQNPYGSILDAVFIEGHTDNQTFHGDTTEKKNRLLSTSRSNAVYQAMVLGNEQLSNIKNSKDESLFSLSGYGADRPLPGHEHKKPTSDAANRRIELRFIFEEAKITDDELMLLKEENSSQDTGKKDES